MTLLLKTPIHTSADGLLAFSRFLNVLRFVTLAIVEEQDRVPALRGRLQQILSILYEKKVDFEYWGELALSCPTSEDIGKRAAVKARSGESWTVRTPREIAVAARLLRYMKLTQFKVQLGAAGSETLAHGLEALMEELGRCHTGGLELELTESYSNFSATEKALVHLRHSR